MNFVGLATAILNATGRLKRHRIFKFLFLQRLQTVQLGRPGDSFVKGTRRVNLVMREASMFIC